MPTNPVLLADGTLLSDDHWTWLPRDFDGEAPPSYSLVPLPWYETHAGHIDPTTTGVWLDSDQPPDALPDDALTLPVIAIHFPVFTDGRGFSYARLLRRRGFTGDLRAIGDVLLDQVFFFKRCGFSSFALREDQDPEEARAALDTFAIRYQAAEDNDTPLFRQRWTG